MKNLCSSVGCVVVVSALAFGSTSALAQNLHPNGFPSGAHFNLNIIGKKADYICAPAQPDPITGLYGNVIFIPEYGLDPLAGQIIIRSGRKGGKPTESWSTELQVLDACSPAFDHDAAEVQLPPSENGYWVYARALAKPGGDATLSYSGGPEFSVIDEYGADLVYLGLVTSAGVALPEQPIQRGKGKSVAVDITGMFMFTGTICNIDYSGFTTTDPLDPVGYRPLCWTDMDASGAPSYGDIFKLPVVGLDGALSCTTDPLIGITPVVIWVPVTCFDYSDDPEWIFNLGELVQSDWLVDNNGMKLIQIRFYPVTTVAATSLRD